MSEASYRCVNESEAFHPNWVLRGLIMLCHGGSYRRLEKFVVVVNEH